MTDTKTKHGFRGYLIVSLVRRLYLQIFAILFYDKKVPNLLFSFSVLKKLGWMRRQEILYFSAEWCRNNIYNIIKVNDTHFLLCPRGMLDAGGREGWREEGWYAGLLIGCRRPRAQKHAPENAARLAIIPCDIAPCWNAPGNRCSRILSIALAFLQTYNVHDLISRVIGIVWPMNNFQHRNINTLSRCWAKTNWKPDNNIIYKLFISIFDAISTKIQLY